MSSLNLSTDTKNLIQTGINTLPGTANGEIRGVDFCDSDALKDLFKNADINGDYCVTSEEAENYLNNCSDEWFKEMNENTSYKACGSTEAASFIAENFDLLDSISSKEGVYIGAVDSNDGNDGIGSTLSKADLYVRKTSFAVREQEGYQEVGHITYHGNDNSLYNLLKEEVGGTKTDLEHTELTDELMNSVAATYIENELEKLNSSSSSNKTSTSNTISTTNNTNSSTSNSSVTSTTASSNETSEDTKELDSSSNMLTRLLNLFDVNTDSQKTENSESKTTFQAFILEWLCSLMGIKL